MFLVNNSSLELKYRYSSMVKLKVIKYYEKKLCN